MITFITAHDGTEPFETMAHALFRSVFANDFGAIKEVVVNPNGGHYLVEFYSAMYPVFSQAIQKGPVVILDSDCIVQRPLDDIFERDFTIGAIHRGKCANSMGTQDFLGSLIAFHPKDPNEARHFWHSWMAHVYSFLSKPVVTASAVRSEGIKAKGWHHNWYGGQAAYNDILYELEKSVPKAVLRLSREYYAASPGTVDAYVVHAKGTGKLK